MLDVHLNISMAFLNLLDDLSTMVEALRTTGGASGGVNI
jgi:hypothetical protein